MKIVLRKHLEFVLYVTLFFQFLNTTNWTYSHVEGPQYHSGDSEEIGLCLEQKNALREIEKQMETSSQRIKYSQNKWKHSTLKINRNAYEIKNTPLCTLTLKHFPGLDPPTHSFPLFISILVLQNS